MAKVLISLGANTPDKQPTLLQTLQAIGSESHIVAQTPIYITPAEGNHSAAPYANALVVAIVDEDYDTLRQRYKQWEADAGRNPESKQKGIIPLDIDIIMWDNTILKVKDLHMSYMKVGLQLLQERGANIAHINIDK